MAWALGWYFALAATIGEGVTFSVCVGCPCSTTSFVTGGGGGEGHQGLGRTVGFGGGAGGALTLRLGGGPVGSGGGFDPSGDAWNGTFGCGAVDAYGFAIPSPRSCTPQLLPRDPCGTGVTYGSALAAAAGIVMLVCRAEGFGTLAGWGTEGAAPTQSEGIASARRLVLPGLGKQRKHSHCTLHIRHTHEHTHTQTHTHTFFHACVVAIHVCLNAC